MKKQLILTAAATAMLAPTLLVGTALLAQDRGVGVPLGFSDVASPALRVLEDAARPESWGQVRIEERVIIRISPSPPEVRQRLQDLVPRRASQGGWRETSHTGCIRVGNIQGVMPTADNRLLLFMENRRVLAASLERGCDARAFYSGFYLEPSDDGRLCVDRDRLQSRAGASCSLDTLRRIVPLDEDD
ncbi:hypothetical protein [Alteraurantiacibacter buctensis]|uniref:DUF3617 family protein n=1 Tax=Alteraurantiacibacter buctensis TaxID=1503981 RepID=A0A844YXF7_9SPHN|nr:hypothetical protein [Alteraurantiacibacter buctensis]MXO71491.1 hypothetical protein [Alteraurantiacibacter buctensis]